MADLTALSRRSVPLGHRALDARRGRRALRRPPAQAQRRRPAQARLSRGQSAGQGAGAQAQGRGHHRSGGDLRLSRRRVPQGRAQHSGRRSAPRRLSAVAVLRAELHGARDHRPRVPAQGRAARRRGRLPRHRGARRHRRAGGGEGALHHGRAVHRRRRGGRLGGALGHDVQAHPGARRVQARTPSGSPQRPALQRAEAKDKALAA